ncbi:MAG: hypothetical protein U0575_03450 [Phycisphaerales bacterium]
MSSSSESRKKSRQICGRKTKRSRDAPDDAVDQQVRDVAVGGRAADACRASRKRISTRLIGTLVSQKIEEARHHRDEDGQLRARDG